MEISHGEPKPKKLYEDDHNEKNEKNEEKQ